MKLATLKDGTRDGKLVVVSRDLTRFTDASFLARTLQAALDLCGIAYSGPSAAGAAPSSLVRRRSRREPFHPSTRRAKS